MRHGRESDRAQILALILIKLIGEYGFDLQTKRFAKTDPRETLGWLSRYTVLG